MSTTPTITYELVLEAEIAGKWNEKEAIKAWLTGSGIDCFVEGVVDDLDIDHAYENPQHDFYSELGGNESPLSIYSYSLEHLEDLKTKLLFSFKTTKAHIRSMQSEVWMEGWKESFKPIYTEKFVVFPPWEKVSVKSKGEGFQGIEIEPGMAFGTGQHATTQICLQNLENLELENQSVLDVGTGTGVLAVATHYLGAKPILGTDIDVDAVRAAKENASRNGMQIDFVQGSVPDENSSHFREFGYDLVVANILYVVLAKIIGDLAAAVASEGKLMLSGVLIEQEQAMIESAKDNGLFLEKRSEMGGWVCLIFSKKPEK